MPDVKLTSCRVQRHLGIGLTVEPIRLTELSSGINLIYGPNGRGKSCLADAIVAVLWGQSSDPNSDITAEIKENDQPRQIRLAGPLSTPCRDLPPPPMAPLYRMALQDLLRSRDGSIADAIRRQLYGNLDPGAAARTLDFFPTVLDGRLGEWRELNAARSAHGEELKRQSALSRETAKLPADQNRLRSLDADLSRAPNLQRRLERLRAETNLASAQNAVELLDPRLAACAPDDGKQLAAIRRDLREANQQITEAVRLLADAAAAQQAVNLQAAQLPDAHTLDQFDTETQKLLDMVAELRQLERTTDRARSDLALATEKHADAVVSLSQTALPQLPPAGLVEELDSKLRTMARIREQLADSQAECATVNAKLTAIQQRLGDRLKLPQYNDWQNLGMPIINSEALIPQAVRTAELHARLERLQTELQNQPPLPSVAEAEAAIATLNTWLAAAEESSRPPWLECTVAIVGGILAAHFQLPVGAIIAFLAGGLIWIIRLRPPPPRPISGISAAFSPAAATPEAVTAALARATEVTALNRLQISTRSNLDQKLRELQQEAVIQEDQLTRCLNEITQVCGLAPDPIDAVGLSQFARTISDLAETRQSLTAAQARHEFLAAQLNDQAEALTTTAQQWLPAPPSSPEQAAAALQQATACRREAENAVLQAENALKTTAVDAAAAAENQRRSAEKINERITWFAERLATWQADAIRTDGDVRTAVQRLRQRVADFHKAGQAIDSASRQRTVADDMAARRSQDLKQFLDERGLSAEATPDNCLTLLLEQLPDWRECQERLANARQRLREAIANDRECELGALSEADIIQQLAELEAKGAEREKLVEAMAELRGRLDLIRRGTALLHAEARLAAAKDALAARRDAELPRRMGAALMNSLLADMPHQNAPVLAAADRLLRQFTRNRTSLVIDAEGETAELQARDTATERLQTLDHLSSGTRIQLLMAARLAFLQQHEGDSQPPVILDELLANSDTDRAVAMMNAVTALAESGRQIFYFTADPTEIAVWQSHLATHAPELPVSTIALAPFAHAATASQLSVHPPLLPEPPLPDESLPAYGARIAVPPLNPWQDAAAAHLWYISATPHELAGLLRTVGAICAQLPTDLWPELHLRRRVLDQLLLLWRRGRGKPVTWSMVQEADAISSRFLDEANQCLITAHGEAADFLSRMNEIRGFRKTKLDQLTEHLTAAGCIPEAGNPPLPAAEVARRLHREFPERAEHIRVVLARTAGALYPDRTDHQGNPL